MKKRKHAQAHEHLGNLGSRGLAFCWRDHSAQAAQRVYYGELSGECGYCIPLNKEAGLANLTGSSLSREQSPALNIQGERVMVDISALLSTYAQTRGRFCHPLSFPLPWPSAMSTAHIPAGLASLRAASTPTVLLYCNHNYVYSVPTKG